MPTGFETHGGENGVAEGGVDFCYCKSGPKGDPGEGALLAGVGPVWRFVRDSRTPADDGGGAPFPGRMTRSARRGRPARPSRR